MHLNYFPRGKFLHLNTSIVAREKLSLSLLLFVLHFAWMESVGGIIFLRAVFIFRSFSYLFLSFFLSHRMSSFVSSPCRMKLGDGTALISCALLCTHRKCFFVGVRRSGSGIWWKYIRSSIRKNSRCFGWTNFLFFHLFLLMLLPPETDNKNRHWPRTTRAKKKNKNEFVWTRAIKEKRRNVVTMNFYSLRCQSASG